MNDGLRELKQLKKGYEKLFFSSLWESKSSFTLKRLMELFLG